MPSFPSPARWYFESLDRGRKLRGAAMDWMGYGPMESPYQTVLTAPGVRLRYYGGAPDSKQIALIIPAPIKRHYIWDLGPECSVVQRALGAGMKVYLSEWIDPGREQANFGLAEYAYTLIDRCVAPIRAANPGARLFLLSHSLGGVLAAIYAASHPELVDGLALIETPLHFGEATGSFAPLLTVAPPAGRMAQAFDNIPGSILSLASVTASPTTFQVERYADLVASMTSSTAFKNHMQVERWTLDEAPMSGRLFEEVVEALYREDRFMRGQLMIHGRTFGPSDIVSPMLSVFDPRSLIIPPASITAFQAATSSSNKRLLPYHGDKGVALSHVGALVGSNAHSRLWPEIFGWISEISMHEASLTRH